MHTALYSNDPREYAEREARAAGLNSRAEHYERVTPASEALIQETLEQRAKDYMRGRVLELVRFMARNTRDVAGMEDRIEGMATLARMLLADRDIRRLDEAERLVNEAIEEGRKAA